MGATSGTSMNAYDQRQDTRASLGRYYFVRDAWVKFGGQSHGRPLF
jgi:hypothetical protein